MGNRIHDEYSPGLDCADPGPTALKNATVSANPGAAGVSPFPRRERGFQPCLFQRAGWPTERTRVTRV